MTWPVQRAKGRMVASVSPGFSETLGGRASGKWSEAGQRAGVGTPPPTLWGFLWLRLEVQPGNRK